ncbi:FHF complex subunit HOOK-interacting protein 2B-like [Centroberyx affinis]|uniref:FHF complex subunit HOOK-interacting protein 2B-like n=1 Tax=Centroberyx affinis TaxID=166261 RepID=UPI003A5BBFAD
MASLCLVEELLRKPHRTFWASWCWGTWRARSYLAPPPAAWRSARDLEEDPFFSDQLLLPPPPSSPSSPSSSCAPPPCGLGPAADIVNSFLCLVPHQARSAHLLQEGGYDSYIHDAHSLVKECQSLSQSWDWPVSLPPPSSSSSSADFYEGLLLKVLLDRLGRILEQPYELNLQLTSLLSRLSAFSHPLLQEYLLNPYINLSHCSRSPFSVLIRVRQTGSYPYINLSHCSRSPFSVLIRVRQTGSYPYINLSHCSRSPFSVLIRVRQTGSYPYINLSHCSRSPFSVLIRVRQTGSYPYINLSHCSRSPFSVLIRVRQTGSYPYINLSHCSRSPFSVLIRVIGELMQRIQLVPNLTDRLVNVRRQLVGLDNSAGLENLTLLRGVIVLEEFCKELAAIAFVKLPLDQD